MQGIYFVCALRLHTLALKLQRAKLYTLIDMPEKTSKRQSARAADGTDDDFDRRLAEVMAADPTPSDAVHTWTETTTSLASASASGDRSSSRSSSRSQVSSTPKATVSDEAIINACRKGNLTQLQRWGRQGVRVQSAEPLICAVFNGAPTNVLCCLVNDLGADVNLARADRATAVFVAAQLGFLAVMRCLVKELGAGAHQVMNDGSTPLYVAAQNAHLAVVQCLVKEFGADANQLAEDGCMPLHVAANNCHLALVRFLVREAGADVNQAVSDNSTPTFFAAKNGDLAVVRFLVEELGADVNQARSDGTTPLYIAAQYGHLGMVRWLVKELGANVNQATHKGYTPLMVAAKHELRTVVEFLIKYGARPQTSAPTVGTAADLSKRIGAPAEQTAYLEARTHCAQSGCSGAGVKKCAGCLKVYYCARECQLAHWSAHKQERRQSADMAASKTK
jgi:ankyrin repeat protein